MNLKEQSRQEYKARINRVMDYVEKNLDQHIDLVALSEIAHFSPYHFHRMFTFITGETPNNFLLRLRIEKAASLLLKNDGLPIKEIAYRCGFTNSSTFSRTFRKFYGITAQEYKNMEKAVFSKNGIQYSKNGKAISKIGQQTPPANAQLCSVEFKNLVFMDTKIEVKKMPDIQVIYCRHLGQFNQIHKAFEKVIK